MSQFPRLAVLSLSLAVASAQAETFLHLASETLSGRQTVLPDDAHGRIALLVIGFTKKSSHATRAWGQRFNKDFGNNQHYVVYQIAVLQDVPRFIRGMVTSGIRRETPPGEQEHFLTAFNGEEDMKRFVSYSAPDEAYLLLLDAKGEIRWRGHGSFLEQNYADLQEATNKLGPP
jgi:ATP10 protein